jgi:hypothetical protein
VFPERDLANKFWVFVAEQAMDHRFDTISIRTTVSSVLDKFEGDRRWLASRIKRRLEGVQPEANERPYPEGEDELPWIYPSLNEALLGFLVNEVARDMFPYSIGNWLRTVVLILADVHHNPSLLQVHAISYPNDPKIAVERREFEHTMVITDDDWSFLYQEVFELIKGGGVNSIVHD